MAGALWVAGGLFLLVYCGTWAIQIGVWLIAVVIRLAAGLGLLAFGMLSIAILAIWNRDELRRIWRDQRADAAVTALLARERWS